MGLGSYLFGRGKAGVVIRGEFDGVLFLTQRSRVLDAHCAELGRDPAEIIRSVLYIVDYDDPAATRATVLELIGAGYTHIVLGLRAPYPGKVATWPAENVITPVRERL